MSTRAIIRFATREEGVSFSEHPENINAQFYNHSDGYPEGLGIEIAESILSSNKINNWEIDYLDTRRADLDYIYYVWQHPDKSTWISIFKTDSHWCEYSNKFFEKDECIFVGEPSNLIERYKLNTNTYG